MQITRKTALNCFGSLGLVTVVAIHRHGIIRSVGTLLLWVG